MRLETDLLTYSATGILSNTYYETFVAVRNKASGKTRLFHSNEMELAPVVNYPQTTNPLLLQEHIEEKTSAEKLAESKSLIKSFGQSKGQRFYDQQEKMKIDSSQTEDKIMKAAGSIAGEALEEAPKAAEIRLIPKRNDQARRTDGVYVLEEILSKSEIDQLRKAGENLLQDLNSLTELKKAQEKRDLSPLGVFLLNKCLNSENNLGNRVAIILFMEGIIKVSKLRPGQMRRAERSLQQFLPVSAKKKLVSLFLQTKGDTTLVTPELKDRAVCYTIVFALLANTFRLDTSLLSESIRVRADQLKKLVMMVGATTMSDSMSQGQTIVLRLPLSTFSMEYVPKAKKRGGGGGGLYASPS